MWVAIVPLALLSCQQKGGNAGVELKTQQDSAGYALGVDLVSSLKEQKMASMNFGLVSYAMEEVLSGKTARIEPQQCGMLLSQYAMKMNFDSTAAAEKARTTFETKDGAPVMKDLYDSAGYALGVNVATTLKMQGMDDINRKYTEKAINVALAGDSLLLKPEQCLAVLNSYMATKSRSKVDANIKEGEAFLEKNGKRPEVKTTASGLQYEVIKEGSGPKATINDVFVAKYRGTLLDGTEFDGNMERPEPLEMGVNQVIAGWIEGLQLMSPGSHYKFYIPYQLGYGLQGSPPRIPGGAMLTFDLQLLDLKKGAAQ